MGHMRICGFFTYPNFLKQLLLVCIVIAINANSYCQQKMLQFKHLSSEQGLSSSKANCALQDHKGFMWIGTYDGLNRYDGSTFKIYKKKTSDSGSISGDYIRTIFEDRSNNLFICSDRGLSLYNRDFDCFVNLFYEKSSPFYNQDIVISNIVEDSTGNLWLATINRLIYFDRKKNKLTQYYHDPDNASSISSNFITYVFVDSKERLWACTTKGLNLYSKKTNSFVLIKNCKSSNENIADINFLNAAEDFDGNIWFGSTEGLFCFENKTNSENVALNHYSNNARDPNSISKGRIKTLLVDNDGNLWIGSDYGGLSLYNKQKNNFSHHSIDEFNPMSLNNQSINALAKDWNNNLWVCTHGGGVNLASKNSGFIVHYKTLPGASQSLSYNIVSCFIEDRLGQLWVGTDGGGLNFFNGKTSRFTRYNNENSQLSSNSILGIAEGSSNKVWIGTWSGGLIDMNILTHTFKAYTTKNSNIPDNSIYAVAQDEFGDLWLGSFESGLIHFKTNENKFIAFVPENSNVCNIQVNIVKSDKKGKLFLGTLNGFQTFIPAENKFVSYSSSLTDPKSISNSCVYDILLENDTTVWIATNNGLNRFNPASGLFKKYYTENGLPHNTIKGLTFDKLHRLWLTTKNGISCFDQYNNKFRNFDASDGLQSTEFYERSIVATNNGKIFVGGSNGFSQVTPEEIPDNKKKPEVVLTDFYIFNEKVRINGKGSPLKKQISETKSIVLSYNQSVLTFCFSALDFTNTQKNQYAYMMENFDKTWNYCGNRRDATYTNLSPGVYTFRVKASNNDGVWTEAGTSIEIIITPPWWKSNTARIIYSVFIMFVLLGVYYYGVTRLKEQKNILEKLVRERTSEIEDKNLVLLVQTNELNEVNELLKERQHQIEKQNKLLTDQAEVVFETNILLKEHQTEIEKKNQMLILQAEQLSETNDLLKESKEEVMMQNEELEKHRNHLELLVEERTAELLKAKLKAEESDRLKTSFLNNMSHEIRTPMNAICGFAGLLESEPLLVEKKKKYVKLIIDNSQSLLSLIENILDLSAIEVDCFAFKNEKYNVHEVLINLESFFKLNNEKCLDIEFVNKDQNNNIIMFNDEERFRQVIMNLLKNAYMYTETGSIKFGYEVLNKSVRFFVSDTGIGIESAEYDKIFNHFYKIENNPNKLFRGNGLGLAICKNIVEMMGGVIWVESELGKGSVFYVTLPFSNEVA
jgi:ligand-binding sensor domain-containing protein/signal transduction histidine kinase